MPRGRDSVIDMKMTGLNIKNLMKMKGMSVQFIMNKLCLSSHQSVYSWFEGSTLPSVDNFLALSVLLDVPVDYLIVSRKESFTADSNETHFIYLEDLPSEAYERMFKLMREFNVPFNELLLLFEQGFDFCCLSEKQMQDVELD